MDLSLRPSSGPQSPGSSLAFEPRPFPRQSWGLAPSAGIQPLEVPEGESPAECEEAPLESLALVLLVAALSAPLWWYQADPKLGMKLLGRKMGMQLNQQ